MLKKWKECILENLEAFMGNYEEVTLHMLPVILISGLESRLGAGYHQMWARVPITFEYICFSK